jgi:hypothetical protein
LGAVPVHEHDGGLALARRAALCRVGLPACGLGEDVERQVAIRRRGAHPGARPGCARGRGHAALLLLVPRERRCAERGPVRDARRARRVRGRPWTALRPAHGHRRVRRGLPELELRARGRARHEPVADHPRVVVDAGLAQRRLDRLGPMVPAVDARIGVCEARDPRPISRPPDSSGRWRAPRVRRRRGSRVDRHVRHHGFGHHAR